VIIDGTGADAFEANLAVQGPKIARVTILRDLKQNRKWTLFEI